MSNSCTESADASLLLQPKIKRNPNFAERYAFPICRESEENAEWNVIIGHLKDNCVEVTNEENIELLFTMGFFGKGSLSRSTPQAVENKMREFYGEKKRNSRSWSKSKQKKDNNASETVVCESDSEKDEVSAKRMKTDEIYVVLSDTNESDDEDSDSSCDNICVTSNKEEKEVLHLSFEEAYFLSYGLGTLVVKDKDQPLDLMRLWNKFCEIHPSQNFPVMYTAYHHFRSKGWIVRSGMKYGTDFVLYKDGPPFYHSTYTVIVKPVKEQNLRDIMVGGRPNFTWASLSGLNRSCTHVSKAVIILYVIKPTTISDNKISTPFCVSQYKLEEVLVHRWVPSTDGNPTEE